MPVTVIDKIKQKNNGTFSLLDYIDINGRINGWQDPVKRIIPDIASIGTLTDGDRFILEDASGTWNTFKALDIYGRLASAENNAIYEKQTDNSEGTPYAFYLVCSPFTGMITLCINDSKLKVFNGIAWSNLSLETGVSSGETIRAKTEFVVNTGAGGNYDTANHRLTLGIALLLNDNINIYVNGLKYSHEGTNNAFTFSPGEEYVVWIPNSGNAGFELITGDSIEVEIFKN